MSQRIKIILNFLSIYIIWGSTYLAIKYALVGLTPFLMAGLRFVTAGVILFLISKSLKESNLSKDQIKNACVSGTLLTFGNALVCVAELHVSSGIAAIVVGSMPVWISFLSWKFFKGKALNLWQSSGILISLLGIMVLTGHSIWSADHSNWSSYIILLLATLSWAVGTLWQRKALMKQSFFQFSSVQLFVGGLVMILIFTVFENPLAFNFDQVQVSTLWSLIYLIIFGSVMTFTSYLWLNQNVQPTLVSTYALVNPVIAVWLGWLILNESLSVGIVAGSILVLFGTYMILFKAPRNNAHKKIG